MAPHPVVTSSSSSSSSLAAAATLASFASVAAAARDSNEAIQVAGGGDEEGDDDDVVTYHPTPSDDGDGTDDSRDFPTSQEGEGEILGDGDAVKYWAREMRVNAAWRMQL